MLTPNCDHVVLKCNHHHVPQSPDSEQEAVQATRKSFICDQGQFLQFWGVWFCRNTTEAAASHGKAALKDELFNVLLHTFLVLSQRQFCLVLWWTESGETKLRKANHLIVIRADLLIYLIISTKNEESAGILFYPDMEKKIKK